MQPIIYIIYAVLEYLIVTAFLLRLLLPLVRANMRNPLSQAVMRATNPLVMPLRRALPPVGRVDTASVVALILVQFVTVLIIALLAGYPLTPEFLLRETGLELIREILRVYGFALFIYVLLSWVAPHTYSPAGEILGHVCEPILRRIRRVIPPLAGLDFSAFFALILITASLMALPRGPFPFN